MLDGIQSTVGDLLSNWGNYWEAFDTTFSSFRDFGFTGMERIVSDYISTQGSITSPTLMIFAVLYILVSSMPFFMIGYVLVKKYTGSKKYGIAVGILAVTLITAVSSYLLELKPTPVERFEAVAYGPATIFSALAYTIVNDTTEAFMAISAFVFFFILSYLMWYLIMFMIYGITIMFMQEPIFSQSSGKGHAMWMTILWLFFLSVLDSGSMAFVNVLLVLLAIIVKRSEIWEKRGSGNDNGDTPTFHISSDELQRSNRNSGTKDRHYIASGDDSDYDWENWIDEE